VARHEVTHLKAGVNTANTIMWQLRASSSGCIRLLELALSVSTAPTTGPSWRLNRPTAIGTSSATVAPQKQDSNSVAATALLDTTWSTPLTLAAIDLRRYTTPQTIGSGIVWTWYDQPLMIPLSMGIAIVNGNATGTTLGNFVVYAVFDE
jgi:hypothetical protein